MRQMLKPLAFLLIAASVITSCKKEVKEAPQDEISQEILSKISNHGFGTSNVQKDEDGYLVEGDIILTEEFLNSTPGGHYLRIAETEQYRTTNLVSGLPRVITVSSSGSVNSNVSSAINAAIARYNAENLLIDMVRVTSGGEINIKIVNGGNYIASAGFPSGGDPYSTVKFNRQYQNWPLNTVTTVIAHEIGHCIGFRIQIILIEVIVVVDPLLMKDREAWVLYRFLVPLQDLIQEALCFLAWGVTQIVLLITMIKRL